MVYCIMIYDDLPVGLFGVRLSVLCPSDLCLFVCLVCGSLSACFVSLWSIFCDLCLFAVCCLYGHANSLDFRC